MIEEDRSDFGHVSRVFKKDRIRYGAETWLAIAGFTFRLVVEIALTNRSCLGRVRNRLNREWRIGRADDWLLPPNQGARRNHKRKCQLEKASRFTGHVLLFRENGQSGHRVEYRGYRGFGVRQLAKIDWQAGVAPIARVIVSE